MQNIPQSVRGHQPTTSPRVWILWLDIAQLIATISAKCLGHLSFTDTIEDYFFWKNPPQTSTGVTSDAKQSTA